MPVTYNFVAELSGLNRIAADLENVTRVADRDVWRDMARLFATRSYGCEHGLVTVTADWSPVVECIFHETQFSTAEWMSREPEATPPSVHMPMTINDRDGNVKEFNIRDFAELFFYEAYLVSNLAVPGSFGSTLVTIEYDRLGDVKFELESHIFEYAWLAAERNG